MSAVAVAAQELTPSMLALLHAGAVHPFNRCMYGAECRKGKTQDDLIQLERWGYVRRSYNEATITEAGRSAIGVPTETEANAIRVNSFRTTPAEREASQTERSEIADFKRWKTMNLVCVIVAKLPDERFMPTTVKVAIAGETEPHYLGKKNAIVLPESSGRIVLALIPKWLQQRTKMPTYAIELPEGGDWTQAERSKFKVLAQRCRVINHRIHNANKITFIGTRNDVA